MALAVTTVNVADARKRSTWSTNTAPTIGGTPPSSVIAGQAYSFRPSAYDADGNRLKFSVTNRPAWATFDPWTGTLKGTPAASYAGTYSNISIAVSDGVATARLAAFSIVVSAPNQPPTISGTAPASVTAGQAYSFTPAAKDPEGKALTFAVANKPAWATFSATTGQLAGTPTTTDVGTYANVSISASDGAATATLAPFTITVQPAMVGSAMLTWEVPTLRMDGSALTNLAGFRVYYGTKSGSYTMKLDLPNAGITGCVVDGLTTGTYYFVTTAYDTSGVESAYSAEASKTIY